ncbi:MAG: transcriptional regulator [Thermoanaerobaculia bacterium]
MTESRPTRRQEVTDLLRQGEWSVDALRRELEVPVHVLEEDLAHIAKSVRAEGRRLRIDPARCPQCGFTLRPPRPGSIHPPSRCPRCRNERLEGPWLRVL